MSLKLLKLQAIPPSSPFWRIILTVILAFYFIGTLAQSLVIPSFEGSDEQRHYAYARYLVNHLALPPRERVINPDGPEYYSYKVGQQAGQPPLYYVPVALMSAIASNADNVTATLTHNYFAYSRDDQGMLFDNHNVYLHGAEEQFPYSGVALAVRLGRLVSIAMGAVTLLAVYAIATTIMPTRPVVGLIATLVMSCIPEFQFLHAMITNDAAVVMFATLCMAIAVRVVRYGASNKWAVVGGILAAGVTLSKINGLWAVGVVWLAFLIAAVLHRRQKTFVRSLVPLLIAVGVWIILTGWWFAFGVMQDGDPLGLAIHVVLKENQSLMSFSKIDLSLMNAERLEAWDRTTWFAGSWSIVHGPAWIYILFRYSFLIGLAAAVAGSIVALRRTMTQGRDARIMATQLILLGLAMLFSIIIAFYWQSTGRNPLGRYLYPGLTSAIVISAIGWDWLVRAIRDAVLRHKVGVVIGIGAFACMQVAAIYSTIYMMLSLTPHQMIRPVPTGVTSTMLTYVDDQSTPVASLIGYRTENTDLRPQQVFRADLCWKSLGYSKQDVPYSLQLVGPDDTRAGTRNSYHGLGSYPLTSWASGETFCDPTALVIDLPIEKPQAYNIVVTMFGVDPVSQTVGAVLMSYDASGKAIYPVIGRVRVAPLQLPLAQAASVSPTVLLGDLAGFVSSHVELVAGNVLSVTLRWQAVNPHGQNAKVFFHVVDRATDQVIAQDDHEPDAGWFPTSYWKKGDIVVDHFIVQLPATISLDQLSFRTGMYDANTVVRLHAVSTSSGLPLKDNYVTVQP